MDEAVVVGRTGFQQQQTGYASAISLAFFVLVLAVNLTGDAVHDRLDPRHR